jgi:hypothetical protein
MAEQLEVTVNSTNQKLGYTGVLRFHYRVSARLGDNANPEADVFEHSAYDRSPV